MARGRTASEPHLRWVDGFHTGYVLDALRECVAGGRPEAAADEALDRGLAFYRRALFLDDGSAEVHDRIDLPDRHPVRRAGDPDVRPRGRSLGADGVQVRVAAHAQARRRLRASSAAASGATTRRTSAGVRRRCCWRSRTSSARRSCRREDLARLLELSPPAPVRTDRAPLRGARTHDPRDRTRQRADPGARAGTVAEPRADRRAEPEESGRKSSFPSASAYGTCGAGRVGPGPMSRSPTIRTRRSPPRSCSASLQ